MFFNPKEMETYLPYTRALKEFLTKYDEESQKDQMKFEDCGGRFLLKVLAPCMILLLPGKGNKAQAKKNKNKNSTLHIGG